MTTHHKPRAKFKTSWPGLRAILASAGVHFTQPQSDILAGALSYDRDEPGARAQVGPGSVLTKRLMVRNPMWLLRSHRGRPI